MAGFNPNNLECFWDFWNENVVVPVNDVPAPLEIDDLRERLGVSAKPEISSQAFLHMATAIANLPSDTESLLLIQASYIRLVQKHFPWAYEKKS